MANASPSSASTTTSTPSSAWSRLVQITRTASEGSRNKPNESSTQLNQLLPGTHASSSVPPAKKRRLAESPAARSVTKYLPPLSPEPKDLRNMSPGKQTDQISCPPKKNHDCITACPCRVEDVDCVASQQQGENTRLCIPRSGRQLPTTAEDSDQDASPRRPLKDSRRNPSRRVRDSSPRSDEFEPTRNAALTYLGEIPPSEDPEDEIETAAELAAPVSCGSASLEDDDIVAKIVLQTGQPVNDRISSATGPGLHEGDQNSVNKTQVSKRHSPSPASTDESIQMATPSSSPTTKTESRPNEAPVDATKPHTSVSAPKTKRRLTLHGGSYERQSSQKKRKAGPKRKDGVQTTLSLAIGSGAGMRECKLCDTVYNPFHPEDVKVHAKQHAIAVKRERMSEGISGLTASSLVD